MNKHRGSSIDSFMQEQKEPFLDLVKRIELETNPEDIDRLREAWVLIMGTPLHSEIETAEDFGTARFRQMIEIDAYDSAVLNFFLPRDRSTSMPWSFVVGCPGRKNGKLVANAFAHLYHPLSSGGSPKWEGYAPTTALALLNSILQAHAAGMVDEN